MTKTQGPDLTLVKAALTGSNLKKLIVKKKISLWSIHKDCKISYQTLMNWQNGSMPSNELAERVGKHLGLIKPIEADILKIKEQQAELQKKIDRLI